MGLITPHRKGWKYKNESTIRFNFLQENRNIVIASISVVANQSKRAMKRRIKAMDKKLKSKKIKLADVGQAVNLWLGHARHSNPYNLCKKIFNNYPYIKIEGGEKFGNR